MKPTEEFPLQRNIIIIILLLPVKSDTIRAIQIHKGYCARGFEREWDMALWFIP